eukprot:gnl/MRDRNA2_/MRDRNA2_159326_c0_seq1.p1 gnl/MRDRNA2_/MRDRNA2_159326_c0~~gnl/MRDRNA2_/MRDRNA2_159326_c0_seq1.p1  ORF type:complete len:225 (-),score=41.39 gnl/MRDRNA2_/MRDRNA2_159326_c0_seq1:57-731(-)
MVGRSLIAFWGLFSLCNNAVAFAFKANQQGSFSEATIQYARLRRHEEMGVGQPYLGISEDNMQGPDGDGTEKPAEVKAKLTPVSGSVRGLSAAIVLVAFIWIAMVILPLRRKMEENEKLTDEREEFEKFRDRLRAVAATNTQVDKTTLRFRNVDQERRFIVGNALGICKHMRALCAFMVVYSTWAAVVSRPVDTHAFELNPALMNWVRGAAGLLYCRLEREFEF